MFCKDPYTDYPYCSFGNHRCIEKCPYLKSIKDYHAKNEKYTGYGYSSREIYPIIDGGD